MIPDPRNISFLQEAAERASAVLLLAAGSASVAAKFAALWIVLWSRAGPLVCYGS